MEEENVNKTTLIWIFLPGCVDKIYYFNYGPR